MTRRFVAIVLVLAAWIGGTVAGSLGQIPAAASNPGILIGKAHADYTPSLTGCVAESASNQLTLSPTWLMPNVPNSVEPVPPKAGPL